MSFNCVSEEIPLSDRIKVIDYKGHKILCGDSSGLKPAEIVALLPEISRIMIEQKIFLIFQDVNNTTSDETVKKAAIESATKTATALGRPAYSAFIGIRGLQKIIANAALRGQYFASTREEALDWLVQQAEKK